LRVTNEEVEVRQRKLDRLLADGVISYALLWTLFNAGDLVGSYLPLITLYAVLTTSYAHRNDG
jgi:predicted metal-binding membrane protein